MRPIMLMVLVTMLVPAALAADKGTGNAAFDALDRNGDGALTKDELGGERELARRFERFDADKNGRWSVDEFIKANQDRDARVLEDSAITTGVKAMLLAERGVPSTAISVETYEGRVLLSGFVDSAAIKDKAGKVAARVKGVKRVQNNLVVK